MQKEQQMVAQPDPAATNRRYDQHASAYNDARRRYVVDGLAINAQKD
jgi:hypothetical protein